MRALITCVDSEQVAEDYLRALNLCFPGWGGAAKFDWCFRRAAGGPAADLLVAQEEGRIVAGSALTYRRASARGVGPELVACMTGSWTLPEARGRGLFSAMIDASRACAEARGCSLLLAFTTDSNPSCRALRAAGATGQESWYVRSTGSRSRSTVEPVTHEQAEAAFSERAFKDGLRRFCYGHAEWQGQALLRPDPVQAFRVGDAVALIESHHGFNRLLDVSTTDADRFAAAAEALAEAFHPLAAYTSCSATAQSLARRGFEAAPGWIHQISLHRESQVWAPWWFSNADRM